MRALLLTHTFLWWLESDPLLSNPAFDRIADRASEVLVSAATAWEIATKHRIGKLPEAADVARDVAGCIRGQDFLPLSVSVAHGQRAGALPCHHRHPFDRMIAQAILENCALISNDVVFDRYGVVRLW